MAQFLRLPSRYLLRSSHFFVVISLLVSLSDPVSGAMVFEMAQLLVCVMAALVWARICWLHRKGLSLVHRCIGGIFALSCIESGCRLAFYISWNIRGKWGPTSLDVLGCLPDFILKHPRVHSSSLYFRSVWTFGTAKRTAARTFVGMLGLGYGVMSPLPEHAVC